MSLPLLDRFPTDIHPYLIEIADRLWAGHAAVMVGAGFSRNSTKNDHTKNDFPNWSQLGDKFYEKLHGRSPGPKDRYLNVLKLADEVQAAFGRPVLDQLILSNLPDQDHSPSTLQVKLLELPWTDIFTTNYDTLLERASHNVLNYKYNLVLTQQDLIYSEKPRIIKLHGSLPSERPFIVSEEDYRRYPLDFAPFVNTVQQSMLENTFCLVGFSSDDPNFLKWIGWVCDNLGRENAPKLYLIGLLHLTDAQKKLLASRNIVVVSLTEPSSGIGHAEALDNFADFLASQRKKDLQISWPGKLKYHSLTAAAANTEAIVLEWRSLRKQYPNWVVFPYFEVDKLWQYTDQTILDADKILDLPGLLDIKYIYELNWRLERCLMPIYNNLQPAYEKICEKYAGLKAVNGMWLELVFGLWRYYREEGHLEKWQQMSNRLNALNLKGSEYQARYHYECCLYHMALLDLDKLKGELTTWPTNSTLPFWEAKRAGLLAEIGQANDAVNILESALAIVRKRSLGTDSVSDYTWVSQEAYIMQLLHYVKNNRDAFVFPKEEDEQTGFHDRQNQLKLYKCDPWLELDHFNLKLQHDYIEPKDKETNFGFQLNSSSNTYHLSKNNSYLVHAYQLLRYLEETGIPPRLPYSHYAQSSLTNALKRLAIYSPWWVLASMVRSADEKMVERVFDREIIQNLDHSIILSFTDYLITILRTSLESKETLETLRASRINVAIPLILSRVVVRCDSKLQEKILELTLKIYQSDYKTLFKGLKELILSLTRSMNDNLKLEFLPIFLQFPISADEDILNRIPDPFDYLVIRVENVTPDEIIVASEVTENLLNLASSKGFVRIRAITRLLMLSHLGQLSKNEMITFGKILWSQIGSDGFPAENRLLKFSFINLPHPKDIDPLTLYKQYILSYDPPVQTGGNNKGISMGGSIDNVLEDLITGTRSRKGQYGVTWTKEENILIFKKMQSWWAADKHYLLRDDQQVSFLSVPEEFRRRFVQLLKVLSRVLYLNEFWKENPYNTQMRDLIRDIDEHGLPTEELKFKYRSLLTDEKGSLISEIEASLASQEDGKVLPACKTILVIASDPFTSADDTGLSRLINILTDQIKWRNLRIINPCLDTIRILLDSNEELFDDDSLAGMLFGLQYLLKETIEGMEELHINERLTIRKKTVSLAYSLHRYFARKNASIPSVLLEWKEACQNPNEFNEIKLEWPSHPIEPTFH